MRERVEAIPVAQKLSERQPLLESRKQDSESLPAEAELQPDDPLLGSAQQALRDQLLATRLRLQEELREKTKLLKVSSWLPRPSRRLSP